jgi:hypothetical protein
VGQEEIADATSGEVGLMALFAERANDFGGVLFCFPHLDWFGIRKVAGVALSGAKDLGNRVEEMQRSFASHRMILFPGGDRFHYA